MKSSMGRVLAWMKKRPWVVGILVAGVALLVYLRLRSGGGTSDPSAVPADESPEGAPEIPGIPELPIPEPLPVLPPLVDGGGSGFNWDGGSGGGGLFSTPSVPLTTSSLLDTELFGSGLSNIDYGILAGVHPADVVALQYLDSPPAEGSGQSNIALAVKQNIDLADLVGLQYKPASRPVNLGNNFYQEPERAQRKPSGASNIDIAVEQGVDPGKRVKSEYSAGDRVKSDYMEKVSEAGHQSNIDIAVKQGVNIAGRVQTEYGVAPKKAAAPEKAAKAKKSRPSVKPKRSGTQE